MESKAPALTRHSIARLLHTWRGTLSRKSWNEVNCPFCLRAWTIPSTTLAPTLRTADRPMRISSPTGEKSESDSLTSGTRTVMPMRRHSPR